MFQSYSSGSCRDQSVTAATIIGMVEFIFNLAYFLLYSALIGVKQENSRIQYLNIQLGTSLAGALNTLYFNILNLRSSSANLMNLFPLVFLGVPRFGLFIAFCCLSWASLKSYKRLNLQITLTVLAGLCWFIACCYYPGLVYFSVAHLGLMAVLDLMVLRRGTLLARYMSADYLFFHFALVSFSMVLNNLLLGKISSEINEFEFPASFWVQSFLLLAVMLVLIFLVFVINSIRIGSRWPFKAKKRSIKPISLKKLNNFTKRAILCKRFEKDEEESNFYSIDHSPLQLKEDIDYGLKNCFYTRNVMQVRCPNEYMHFQGEQDRFTLEYFVGESNKWKMRLFAPEMKFTKIVKNVWIGSKKFEELFAYFDFEKKRIRIIELRRRKFLGAVEIENSLMRDVRNHRVLGLVKFENSSNFSLISTRNKEMFVWIASAVYSGVIDMKVKVNLNYTSEIVEIWSKLFLSNVGLNVFKNFVAMKFVWIDKISYDRVYPNMSKFHTIVIVEVDLEKKEAKQVSNLSKITEEMFSSLRIDSFFFIDRDTLGIVMNHIVLVVDWERVEVVRCIEVAGLPLPQDRNQASEYKVYSLPQNRLLGLNFEYKVFAWYDRKTDAIFFKVGIDSGYVYRDIEREPYCAFYSNLDARRVKFYLTKYILLGEEESHSEDEEEYPESPLMSMTYPQEELDECENLNQTRASVMTAQGPFE